MGCYSVPAAAAIIHYIARKRPSLRNNKHHKFLNLLLTGAGIFGIIDHLYNRELFVFSLKDLLLGFIITTTIVAFWGIMVTAERVNYTSLSKS